MSDLTGPVTSEQNSTLSSSSIDQQSISSRMMLLKQSCDLLASEHAQYCTIRLSAGSPIPVVIPPNYKFFRRLAGFRNSDLQRKDNG